MFGNVRNLRSVRELLVALLSTSGTLAGIGLALVGVINYRIGSERIETVADDLFLLSSLGFVCVCYLVFFALRHLETPHLRRWTNFIDGLFLVSLTLLLTAGVTVVYALI